MINQKLEHNVFAESDDPYSMWSEEISHIAKDLQIARADILAERLERAVSALVESRLGTTQGRIEDLRHILFDLYDEEIITREQVCERGEINAAEFFDLLDAHRQHEQSA